MTEWVYVALDPQQPGAASAIIVDDGTDLVNLHNTLAKWARRGLVPSRVERSAGIAMLGLWKRPGEQKELL